MNYSKELKPVLVYNDPKEIVPFSSIVVPSTMRSPLWKYFGFPADKNQQILTKNRIVCGICHTYIAYNKNTTNLSTHLNCKHPEVLAQINSSKRKMGEYKVFEAPIRLKSDCESPPRSKQSKMTEKVEVDWYADSDVQSPVKEESHPTGITEKTYIKGKKLTFKSNQVVIVKRATNKSIKNDLTVESDDIDIENQFIETIDYDNIDLNEDGNEIIAEVLETDATAGPSQSKDEYLSEEFLINESNEVLYESSPKEIVISTKFPPKIANKINVKRIKEAQDLCELMPLIKKFLIKDFLPITIVDGSGFKDFIGYFLQNTEIPNSSQIEKCIEKYYDSQHSDVLSGIKSIINSRNYSLSFHKLSGNSSMIEISVNYWSDIGNRMSALENQIFCISKNCTNFIRSFIESLNNCTAFVVDFDMEIDFEEVLPVEIPIIPTFSFVTKMAFEACMQLSAVRTAVDVADEILMGKIKGSHTWLQQFEYLSQFLNDSEENNQIIQMLIGCLQPLKTCLDVLSCETSAYASIMKPVALELIKQHYVETENEIDADSCELSVLEKDLKRKIYQIFQQK